MWSLYNFMGIITDMRDWASSSVECKWKGKSKTKTSDNEPKQLEVRPGKEAKHVNEVDDNEASVF